MTTSLHLVGQQMTTDGQSGTNVAPRYLPDSGENTEVVSALSKQDADNVYKHLMQLQDNPVLRNRKIHYNIHEDLGQVIIKIIDSETDKVIEEIPSVEMQKFLVSFNNQIGLLVNSEA